MCIYIHIYGLCAHTGVRSLPPLPFHVCCCNKLVVISVEGNSVLRWLFQPLGGIFSPWLLDIYMAIVHESGNKILSPAGKEDIHPFADWISAFSILEWDFRWGGGGGGSDWECHWHWATGFWAKSKSVLIIQAPLGERPNEKATRNRNLRSVVFNPAGSARFNSHACRGPATGRWVGGSEVGGRRSLLPREEVKVEKIAGHTFYSCHLAHPLVSAIHHPPEQLKSFCPRPISCC